MIKKSLNKGTKVMIEQTGQIARVINYDYSITHAQLEITTPSGPRVIIILKTLIQVVEIVDGLWPLIKILWSSLFGKKKKTGVIPDANRIP